MIVDTNILIAHLQGEGTIIKALSTWKLSGRVLLISAISRAEVLSRSDLTDSEVEEIKKFLENFTSVPFDSTLAEIAASLRRQYRISLPDAGIAATAIFHEVPLITRDITDFRKISNLQIVTI